MKSFGLLLLSSALLLSACAASAGQPAAAPQPAVQETSDAPQPGAKTALLDEKPPEPAPEPEAAKEPPLPAPPTYTYYMNKNYMIVPKEEGTNKKVVLLTFDDGPRDEAVLTSILDTLKKHDALAIFFVNGYRIKQNPELLQKIVENGHAVGNHAWDHIDLKKKPKDEIDRQLADVQTIVSKITGQAPVFFRPPFGSGNDDVKAKAAEEGMLYMTWSNGSRDWVKEYQVPDKVIASVMEQLHAGSNILMHELPWTAEALDSLLTELKSKGYEFVNPHQIDPAYSKN